MAKYSEEFKLKVAREAAQGHVGIRTLSQIHGIDHSTLRYWLQRYHNHGNNAFVKKHSYYSAEFKLQVITHMKQNSLSSREAIAYFDIRGGTGVVSKWQKQYDEGGFTALEPRPKGRLPKMKIPKPQQAKTSVPTGDQELAQLRKENEYLRAENAYLKKLDALLQKKEQAQKAGLLPKKKHK